MAETKFVRNKPTPEGRALGTQLARLTDKAEPEILARFPNHDRRCASCAFTAGTFPNGCPVTTMDAVKAVVECEPFYCHHDCKEDGTPTKICAGWSIAISATEGLRERLGPLVADWEFSGPVDENKETP